MRRRELVEELEVVEEVRRRREPHQVGDDAGRQVGDTPFQQPVEGGTGRDGDLGAVGRPVEGEQAPAEQLGGLSCLRIN